MAFCFRMTYSFWIVTKPFEIFQIDHLKTEFKKVLILNGFRLYEFQFWASTVVGYSNDQKESDHWMVPYSGRHSNIGVQKVHYSNFCIFGMCYLYPHCKWFLTVTSFPVRAAPKSWSKNTTNNPLTTTQIFRPIAHT